MKLDKRHLRASVVVLALSIIYNVWVFMQPARGRRPAQPTPAVAGARGPIESPIAAIPADPAAIPPPPPVDLKVDPAWPRNPFVGPGEGSARPQAVAGVEAGPPAEPVVRSILYSIGRRLAIVDGRIVSVGDRVGEATVVEITPNTVVLRGGAGERRTLTLRPTAGTGRGR